MNMVARLTLICGLIFFSFSTVAQTYNITGTVIDAKDNSALIGVTIVASNTVDTTLKTGTVTDANGKFEIDGLNTGKYLVHLDYIGYKAVYQTISIAGKNVDMGKLSMKTTDNELKGVTVTGKQIRADQLGDTSQFHADAYKTHPDATAEDLITKMPGMTSDNTGVKVNGEAVQQVYVDGKPFFGTDPTLALRNLPAEVIDKIQVFDKLSDQATFTGFDDGNSQKTMNIVTKKNKSEGQFGKVYGGYGTDDKYLAGGNFNSFDGDRRISILELSNNVNQQNFSSQDILGVTGGSGGTGRGSGGGAFGGGGGNGGGAGSNFLTGQQAGITTTNSAGINYSDQWGKKIKVTGSYFFNNTTNTNSTLLSRDYTFPAETYVTNPLQQSLYNEGDSGVTKNFNHRFNVRFEYTIDSFNSLIITPNLSLQQNYATTRQIDTSYSLADALISNSLNNSQANNGGYTFSNNILLQHKFHKKGRTISVNFGTSLNEKSGDGFNNSNSGHVDTLHNYIPAVLNQNYTLYNNSYTLSSNISYTEPLGKKSQLQFSYIPSYTNSKSDKETDSMAGLPVVGYPDTALSNKYSSTYTTQRGGLSYRLGDKKLNLMIGANVQYAVLDGAQEFPTSMPISRTFTNVLPNVFFNYRFKDGRNLRITYRTNISPPGVTQLQNVVDRSNPLQLSTGNPNLKQDYEQTFLLRYGLTKSKTAHNFFVYGFANYINNYIGTATYTQNSLVPSDLATSDVNIIPGGQLTRPVNLNYYSNNKLFLTYSLPAEFIKSNFNLNGGLSYTHTPGVYNDIADYSNNYIPTLGVVLSSNVSEKLDFTLAYSGNYNFVKNSLQVGSLNNNYYSHTASFKINWIFLKGVVFNTNISHNYYSTFSSSAGNIDYFLWNAYVGYKFFKNRSLEARISAFDILNQNKSVTRTVAANYVENDVTKVLQQYFMFQLTYTLRHFKGVAPVDEAPKDNNLNIPGMPPGGPGGWRGRNGG